MSKPAPKSKRRRGPGRSLLRLHRRIGVIFAAVFIAICLTGIALNHQDDLPFQKRIVTWDWVYRWYGIAPENAPQSYSTPSGRLTLVDEKAYWETNDILTTEDLKAVTASDELIALASAESITLLTTQGELLETLTGGSLPATPIDEIAFDTDGQLFLLSDKTSYRSDMNLLSWEPAPWPNSLSSIAPEPTPAELSKALLSHYRGSGITWGRLLLDLHTGRFFGSFGKWVADISTLALVFLTLSGVLYTTRYLKRAREKEERN